MSKLRYSWLFLSVVIAVNVYAQTPGAFAGMSEDNEPAILSPGDFSSRVKDMGKQTQTDLEQEINSQLKKPAPPGAGNAPSQPVTPPTPQPSSPDNSGQTQTAPVAPLPPPENAPDTQEQSGATPSAGTVYQGAPASPSQNQPYTGFGASNNNGNNPPPKSSSGNTSGGWNIRY